MDFTAYFKDFLLDLLNTSLWGVLLSNGLSRNQFTMLNHHAINPAKAAVVCWKWDSCVQWLMLSLRLISNTTLWSSPKKGEKWKSWKSRGSDTLINATIFLYMILLQISFFKVILMPDWKPYRPTSSVYLEKRNSKDEGCVSRCNALHDQYTSTMSWKEHIQEYEFSLQHPVYHQLLCWLC